MRLPGFAMPPLSMTAASCRIFDFTSTTLSPAIVAVLTADAPHRCCWCARFTRAAVGESSLRICKGYDVAFADVGTNADTEPNHASPNAMTDTMSGEVGVIIVHVEWQCIPPRAGVGSANCVMQCDATCNDATHECGFALMNVCMFM